MLSLFKDLGQIVQELCASHSLEGTGTGEEEEAATMTAVVAKELKDLMEKKQGLNIRMLAEQIKELKGTVGTMTAEIGNMRTEIQELQQRWSEFIEEEEAARQEYAKYFEEQEKYKQELRADRDRLLEKEHRMEGHLGPSRSEIDEFSDRAYFDAMTKEQEAQEAMEESENEFYTQSYEISEEEAGPQWQEEGEAEATGEEPKEPEKKTGQTQEEYDAERKELLAKARADIAAKEAKRKEQERGFTPPIDKSHDWKFYIDKEGNVWKQNYKTKEKIWWNYDYKYKHQKGKGKQEYEKAGKGHRPHEPFKPRDEEDAKYWERMGKMEEEKRRKREEEKAAAEEKERKEQEARERLEKAAAEEEERQKQKARETLEKAAEENERREAEEKARKAAAAEEKKRKAAAAAAEEEKKRKAAAAAEERKKMEEAEAEKRKEQEANKEKKRIEELEKELAELRGETRSETGSTKGARSETGSTRGEEGKTERQEQASSSSEDPETKAKGPPNPGQYMRGAPKFDEETDRNFYAVFPYDGNDYQWKWNQDSCFWYYYDLEQRRWHRQEGKDVKGKQVCLTQESRWLQAKGKKGKGKGKNKGKEEEEEDLAKHSPEYDYIEAGRQEAEGGQLKAVKKGIRSFGLVSTGMPSPPAAGEEVDASKSAKRSASSSSYIAEDAELRIRNLDFFVESRGTRKDLLKNITAHVRSGEVLAIIGGSGAGKTTLLDSVALEPRPGRRAGQVLLNGQELDATLFRASCAYVAQSDACAPSLTVKETLQFAASLYQGRASHADRAKRVQHLLEECGLDACQQVKVGDGVVIRGVSGGQRRRVSLAVELLKRPSVLVLDEPTSGLDSKAAEAIVELLTGIAVANNLAALCTIHQPSSYVFHQFDKLLVLAKGRVCYFGKADAALQHFQDIGYPSPSGVNPAEFMIRITNADFAEEGQVERICDSWDAICKEAKPSLSGVLTCGPPEVAPRASARKQVGKLFLRAVRSNIRNPTAFAGRALLTALLVSFVCMAYLGARKRNQENVLNYLWAVMWVQQLPAFLCIGAVPNFAREHSCFRKEVKNGLYHPLSHLLADMLVHVPIWFLLAASAIAPSSLILDTPVIHTPELWLLLAAYIGFNDTFAQLCGGLGTGSPLGIMVFLMQTILNMIFDGTLLAHEGEDVSFKVLVAQPSAMLNPEILSSVNPVNTGPYLPVDVVVNVVPPENLPGARRVSEFDSLVFEGFETCSDPSLPADVRARAQTENAGEKLGEMVDEELPEEIQEMMGLVKKPKTAAARTGLCASSATEAAAVVTTATPAEPVASDASRAPTPTAGVGAGHDAASGARTASETTGPTSAEGWKCHVTMGGFRKPELNGYYSERPEQEIQGRASFWTPNQAAEPQTLGNLRRREPPRCQGWLEPRYRSDARHFAKANDGWIEAVGTEWQTADVRCTVLEGSIRDDSFADEEVPNTLKVKFTGFQKQELNTTFEERAEEMIQGKASLWDPTKSMFLYWQRAFSRIQNISGRQLEVGWSIGNLGFFELVTQ
ncbi:ABC transporter G family member 22 [Symbiodinium microadriaticum]|uniref:ABC transporter G family member 22 n=1 Tax=Symbiodinium microadriaticum TaxID=2951 RepID=A0A1Q9C4P9_SYMMI|nr:ABC transporter G family member 22 [Symbiodinium microadriaticum]